MIPTLNGTTAIRRSLLRLERCLTNALRVATQEFNSTLNRGAAEVAGDQFITKWASAIKGANSNIGLGLSLSKSVAGASGVDWNLVWEGPTGYSQVYTHFSMDIEGYCFKGWEASSSRFVSLSIENSVTPVEGGTKFSFTITEGKQYLDEKPIQNLTPEDITLTLNKKGIITYSQITSLLYMGQGAYDVTFDDSFSWENELTMRVATPK